MIGEGSSEWARVHDSCRVVVIQDHPIGALVLRGSLTYQKPNILGAAPSIGVVSDIGIINSLSATTNDVALIESQTLKIKAAQIGLSDRDHNIVTTHRVDRNDFAHRHDSHLLGN